MSALRESWCWTKIDRIYSHSACHVLPTFFHPRICHLAIALCPYCFESDSVHQFPATDLPCSQSMQPLQYPLKAAFPHVGGMHFQTSLRQQFGRLSVKFRAELIVLLACGKELTKVGTPKEPRTLDLAVLAITRLTSDPHGYDILPWRFLWSVDCDISAAFCTHALEAERGCGSFTDTIEYIAEIVIGEPLDLRNRVGVSIIEDVVGPTRADKVEVMRRTGRQYG